jgi:hypothetical protein
MCRAKFLTSQVAIREISVYRDHLAVHSLETIMKELRLPNLKALKPFSLWRRWTTEQKAWFVGAFLTLEKWTQRVVFLHLTKATVSYILSASPSEIVQGMENLEIGHVTDDTDENKRQLLLKLLHNFSPRGSRL